MGWDAAVAALCDIAFEEKCAVVRCEGYLCRGCRDEAGLAAVQFYGVAVAVGKGGCTLHADIYREGVVSGYGTCYGVFYTEYRGGEVGARYQFYGLIESRRVCGFQVIIQLIVYGILGQVGVQLAGLAVGAHAVVVVDAVGNIGGLLYLGYEDTFPYGVYASGRQEKYVAFLYRVECKYVGNGIVGHAAHIFVGRDLLGEARVKPGTRLGIYDIPHFGFSAGVVPLLRQ